MTSGDATARDLARIQSRATIISALLGCIAAIAAALIGANVGKNEGRKESVQKLTAQDAQIVQRDDQISRLKAELLKRRSGQATDTSATSDTDEEAIYKGAVIAQREEQGFLIKFYGCRRGSNAVKCYFDVTNTKAERKFHLVGFPRDQRYSRAYDDHGQQHTANVPEVSGATEAVVIPDGLTVRASLVFATVPENVQRFTDLKFVFGYEYKDYAVDFRDIQL